ncbi:Chlorovirus glycoprotein repeat domain-containing protein [Paramecium bursaria Chlorella virus CZ-2]|nr:Chlorovirus glycoprotein repeat domain-containing protein [Paramecium bursaria Chlorella virus CZ-2]
MSSADFKRDLLQYGGINATNGTIFLKGNIRMLGNGSAMPQLTVGNLTVTGNAVIPGISFASLSVAGNITTGEYFIGNGALLSDVTSILPTTANLDITGNVIGSYANVSNIFATVGNVGNVLLMGGNVTASFFAGNGSQLTGVTVSGVQTLDARGNIIGSYANVANIVASAGNIANIRFAADGNVTASFFAGNGSQLTGVTVSGVQSLDARGNIIGSYANVANIIASAGNVGNTRFLGGNVAVSGQVSVLGNVVAPFFIGNIVGAFANVTNVIAITGNVGNVLLAGGNVTGYNISGQNVFANLITFGTYANVGKMTGVYYVSMNGNDSTADGSEIKPFLTVQAAHDTAASEYPISGGAISKQVQIIICPGTYTGHTTISRFNTILTGAGSLYGKGQMTSVGQVTVNCSSAGFVYNNTVTLNGLYMTSGVINSGSGAYTLNIDSCYITSSATTLVSLSNPNSITYVNNSYVSAAVANVTYVNALGGPLLLTDSTIQTSGSGLTSGYLVNVGGNCTLQAERCSLNTGNTSNAAVYISSSTVPAGGTPFKVSITNSAIQNLGGPGVDFGTTGTIGSFIRNVNTIASGKFVFAGNGIAYYNSLICLPTYSNSKSATVTVVPYPTF